MGKTPILLILFVLGFVLVEGYTLNKTKHRFDPVYILDQFLETNAAVSECGSPDQEQMQRYQRNLRLVTARAATKLRERNPGKSAEEVDELILLRREAREQEVDRSIQAGGCGDPRIKTLLRRFEIQARLRAG
jgi:hypothetical protein